MCRRPPRSTLTDPLVPYSAPSRALRSPVGPAGGAVRQANRHVAVAIPENDRIFHPRFEVAGGDELQVDVQDGLAEEADQKPRLPDMLAGEGIEKMPERLGEPASVGEDVDIGVVAHDQDQVDRKSTRLNSSN